MPKNWWSRRVPQGAYSKTAFPTKVDALRVFVVHNRDLIDSYGGESARHRPAEFDPINRELELEGSRRVQTLGEAIWLALRGGPPWRLADIDVGLLNRTTPGKAHGGFRLPDQVLEEEQARAHEREQEDDAIGRGIVDQCFTKQRSRKSGTFRAAQGRPYVPGAAAERACHCRDPRGRFEVCDLATINADDGLDDVPF